MTMIMMTIKRLLVAVSLLFITAAVSMAQEPIEPAHHRFVARILLGAGHEIVQSFRDCRTDKLWCAAVISTIGLNLTDSAVSCRAKSYGNWYEQNPLLGSNPSCGKMVTLSALGSLGEISSVHKLRDGFRGKCDRDAANPDSMYNHIAASRGIPPSPARCTYGMDLVLPLAVGPTEGILIHNGIGLWRKN